MLFGSAPRSFLSYTLCRESVFSIIDNSPRDIITGDEDLTTAGDDAGVIFCRHRLTRQQAPTDQRQQALDHHDWAPTDGTD